MIAVISRKHASTSQICASVKLLYFLLMNTILVQILVTITLSASCPSSIYVRMSPSPSTRFRLAWTGLWTHTRICAVRFGIVVPRSVSVSHVSKGYALRRWLRMKRVAISVRGASVKGGFIKAFCYEDRRDKILWSSFCHRGRSSA